MSGIEGSGDIVGRIQVDEGLLTAEQVDMILNYLPFDIGFVDSARKLTYSNHGDADLPHLSDEVLSLHEQGDLDSSDGLVADDEGQILLQGTSTVTDARGCYEGVLLFAQNVSPVRALSGERRILDWS